MGNGISAYYKRIVVLRYLFILLFLSLNISGIRAREQKREAHFIIDHIQDAYDWHFATIGERHFKISLPIILYSNDRGVEIFTSSRFFTADHQKISCKGYVLDEHNKVISLDSKRRFYDISITKNVVFILLSMVILVSVAINAARRYRRNGEHFQEPKGWVALLDLIICFVKNEIALPNIGKKDAERFMPYLLTVFFFVWINNLVGLLPGSANVTGNISVTLVLALFTFGITIKSRFYWKHIFNLPGVPKWLFPIMIPVEIIGTLVKPFSLMIRLFANITAGHIVSLSIIGLVFTMKSVYIGVVSVAFGAFMFLLELLVAFLQAYIFTLLSAIYFGMSVSHDHDKNNNVIM